MMHVHNVGLYALEDLLKALLDLTVIPGVIEAVNIIECSLHSVDHQPILLLGPERIFLTAFLAARTENLNVCSLSRKLF
jgi:hypothetical protein